MAACDTGSCGNSHVTSELDDMLLDPTLESCCRRDLEDQKRTAQLKSKLLSLDRTDQRLKHGSILLSSPPHEQKPSIVSHAGGELEEESDFGSDDEFDPEITRLRLLRIDEMKRKAEVSCHASSLGYGSVNEGPWSRVIDRVQATQGCCICHLSVEGHESCCQLDEVLDGLSHLYPKTLFLRSPSCPTRGHQVSTLMAAWGLNSPPPALICFKEGTVVGRCGLEGFGSYGDLMEEQVVGYLKRLRVLKGVSRENIRVESSDEEGEGEDEKGDPCEVCGRRYPHEHVKSIYTTRREDQEEEE